MEWFIAVVIVAALGVAAVAAAGGLGGMAKEPVRDVYRQDLPDDRPLAAAEINALRFGTALRGYAMDQVDDILDRLSREIAERDELITQLRATQPAVGDEAEPLIDDAALSMSWSSPTVGSETVADPSDEVPTDLR
jgi:DivIVA domain-containing protein